MYHVTDCLVIWPVKATSATAPATVTAPGLDLRASDGELPVLGVCGRSIDQSVGETQTDVRLQHMANITL